jgi:hypothetical protein
MANVLPTLLIVAGFVVVMAGLAWLTTRRRGRKASSAVAGPFEEIWHPAAHRARIDIEVQDERTIAPSEAGDPLFPPGPDAGGSTPTR